LVTDRSKDDLPPNARREQDPRYPQRPEAPDHKQQALPLPNDIRDLRDRNVLETPPTQYQKPSVREKSPDGRSLSEDKVRTPSKPGDQVKHPHLDPTHKRTPKRRELRGGPAFPSSQDRQKEQKGDAAKRSEKEYQQNRGPKKTEAIKRYRQNKNRSEFKRKEENRDNFPKRFERRPGGGFKDPAERTKAWREENKEASASRVADFFLERRPPEMEHGSWWDRARRVLDYREERNKKQPAPHHHDIEDHEVPNNPGSAKVIPWEHPEMVNKKAVHRVILGLNWARLPRKIRQVLLKLIKSPLWEQYKSRRKSDSDIVTWFRGQGWDTDLREWEDLKVQLMNPSLGRVATRIAEIERGTNQAVHSKAGGLPVKLKRVDRRNAMLTFHVTGSSDTYIVKVKAPRKGNTRRMEDLDVRVSCTCPFWRWQGPEHHAKAGGYLLGKPRGTASKPDIRDPDGEHGACKHVLAALRKVRGLVLHQQWGKRGSVSQYLFDSLDRCRVVQVPSEVDRRMIQAVTVRYLEQRGGS